jgi:putative transposase
MADKRPPRLAHGCYVGFARYSLTVCTFRRDPVLASQACFALAWAQVLQSARRAGFAVIAFCCMPDHLHMVVEGIAPTSDLEAFVKDFKQRTGYAYKRNTGQLLWQEGYFDRVLREDEQLPVAARYLLANPVRGGLVRNVLEWPYIASERYDLRELLEGAERVETRRV